VNIRSEQRWRVGILFESPEVMTVNRHVTYLRGNRWLLNDTYPDKQRSQNPFLYLSHGQACAARISSAVARMCGGFGAARRIPASPRRAVKW
jgi:hypothetical protein